MLRVLNWLSGGILDPEGARQAANDEAFRGETRELYGLRATAIIIAILHAWPWRTELLEQGWMLMDAFFVMSGFFIGGILLDTRSRPDYYRGFYVRRALRIFPLYFLIVIALTASIFVFGDPQYVRMREKWGSPWWFFFFLGNIPTALSNTWPTTVGGAFTPLWSIQVEEQFYLLFPLLVHRLRTATLARVLWGLVFLSPLFRLGILYLDRKNQLAQYVLLPCRMEGLALGALIAIRFRTGSWKIPRTRLIVMTVFWVALTVTAVMWSGYDHQQRFNRTGGFLLSSITSAYLVLCLFAFRGSRATAWLRLPVLLALGRMSYGIYMLHWPVMSALAAIGALAGTTLLSQGLTRTVAVTVMTIACATLSWRYYETPVKRWGRRMFLAQGQAARGS